MIITIIDGQGGAIGSQLVKMVIKNFPEAEVVAVGTNSIATANMLKAGAVNAATGEHAVRYPDCRGRFGGHRGAAGGLHGQDPAADGRVKKTLHLC